MPDLVPAVLDCLKGDQAGLEGGSAVDCLHRAISRALAAVMATHADKLLPSQLLRRCVFPPIISH